jgi:hypothetical protein
MNLARIREISYQRRRARVWNAGEIGGSEQGFGGGPVEETATVVEEVGKTGPRRRPPPVLTAAAGALDLSGEKAAPFSCRQRGLAHGSAVGAASVTPSYEVGEGFQRRWCAMRRGEGLCAV